MSSINLVYFTLFLFIYLLISDAILIEGLSKLEKQENEVGKWILTGKFTWYFSYFSNFFSRSFPTSDNEFKLKVSGVGSSGHHTYVTFW